MSTTYRTFESARNEIFSAILEYLKELPKDCRAGDYTDVTSILSIEKSYSSEDEIFLKVILEDTNEAVIITEDSNLIDLLGLAN